MQSMGALVRYVGFGLMMVFGLLAGAFIAGETFDRPGGWVAVGLTAAWLVPLVALSVLAVREPDAATRALLGLTALVGVFVAVDAPVGLLPRDALGPVDAVAVFVLGVPLAFLGLRRPRPAGFMLLLLGGMMLVGLAAAVLAHGGGAATGTLAGSSGAVTVPVLVVGALFMLAGALEASRPSTTGNPQAVSEMLSAADRPASSRATGTRNGEQET